MTILQLPATICNVINKTVKGACSMNDSKKTADCQTVRVFCVYVIWCAVTNKYYVGVTYQKPIKRIKQHQKGSQFIDSEIKRIGWQGNWDWWLVEENISAEMITEREQYWVEFFNSVYPNGYNKTCGGMAYFEHSQEVCKKISKAHTGRKCAPFTEEHKANISKAKSGEKNPNFGKPAWNRGIPCTEEAKAKIREKLRGRKRPEQSDKMKGENNPNFGKPMSEETKAKLRAKALERDMSGERNPNYGKHHTEEAKEKIRQARLGKPSCNKGKPLSEETKAKLRESALARDLSGERNPFFGKHHTEEAKEKNRQAHLGKPLTDEHKAKIGEAGRGRQVSDKTRALLREKALARNAAKRAAKAAQMTP